MLIMLKGSIQISRHELNLDLTLLGGQSFRWRKIYADNIAASPDIWCGVAHNIYWELTQSAELLNFVAQPAAHVSYTEQTVGKLLQHYLRSDFTLSKHMNAWQRAHKHFNEIAAHMKAVRILNQEPLENIISFICSQNNHIKRISAMVQWLCERYGQKIGTFRQQDEYTFPTLMELNAAQRQTNLEMDLRDAKFGYRAKFLTQTVAYIMENGAEQWFTKLRLLPYEAARLELIRLPGIGFKVADCICLMSLGHLQAVPVDTHIYKMAQQIYMPELANQKTITPKLYNEIAQHFRNVYGVYAGWAQAVIFCASLPQFKTNVLPEASKSKKQPNVKKSLIQC